MANIPFEKNAPSKVKGEVVNKSGLARVIGRPLVTINSWMERGMADACVIEGGQQGVRFKIDTAKAIDWIISDQVARRGGSGEGNPESLTAERARESRARADKYDLENARTRRELIHVDEVIEHWGKMIGAAKRQVRGLPSQMKTRGVLPELTVVQAAAALALIDEALRELSGSGIPDDGGSVVDDDLEDLGATA